MKKLLALLAATMLVMGFAGYASAGVYYEFSSYGGSGYEYDVACYGNTIYYGGGTAVYSIDVSVADSSKKDEPYYLADGVTLNTNYQARTFSNAQSIPLSGHTGLLNSKSVGEMYVDGSYIYTPGGHDQNEVYKFNKTTGSYVNKVVTTTSATPPRASFLSYGGGKWWMGNENREIWSSTGGDWTHEFTFNNMSGSHGDGMEYVNGDIFVSDMTSDKIAQWEYDGSSWSEKEVFNYEELFGGTNKYVEGMGFGALGHFWAGSGGVVYELGGGDIQPEIDPVPEPCTMLLLGTCLAGLAAFGRKKKLFNRN
ncbi:MAG: PEP-CTERM sorting domain-containing protein [Desulfobacterales bacterium]|nr:PEP-CTERM sorting domain-containing protein [Desulfobacterales bacterium]